MDSNTEYQTHILRKLRKKLRQIENLEQLSRPLNQEELIKVSKKEEIRSELLDLSEELELSRCESKIKQQVKSKNEDKIPTPEIKPKRNKKELNKEELSCDWENEIFSVRTLIGHSDLVTCVAITEDIVISCSRDTTIKIWDHSTGHEKCSLRGHTGSVTCLTLLTEDAGNKLLWTLGYDGKSRVIMTGGVDCMVKIWNIEEGQEIKSFYTYNEVSCIGYVCERQFIVTGSDGGKLDLWNAITAQNLSTVTNFGDSFTNMKVQGKLVYTASSEGFISIWDIQEEELNLSFCSEKLLMELTPVTIPRKIYSLELIGELIYYGDDGLNLKVFNWKTGKVEKFPNHLCDFGTTDAICTTGKEILCSSYNLDFGYGSINVRSLPRNEYITSLGDGLTGRILSMAAVKTRHGKLKFVTGGIELKVWDAVGHKLPKQRSPNVDYVKTIAIEKYNENAVLSEVESSESESDSEDTLADWEPSSSPYTPNEIQYCHQQSSFFNWCSIL